MSVVQAKIGSLESKIEGYENDLSEATTKEEKMMYGGLITETRKTLNALLTQQQQQQQQQGRKFYINNVQCACIGGWVCLSSCYKLVY